MTAMTASAPMTAMTIMTDRGELPVDRNSPLSVMMVMAVKIGRAHV